MEVDLPARNMLEVVWEFVLFLDEVDAVDEQIVHVHNQEVIDRHFVVSVLE